jgi:hypothetical protein
MSVIENSKALPTYAILSPVSFVRSYALISMVLEALSLPVLEHWRDMAIELQNCLKSDRKCVFTRTEKNISTMENEILERRGVDSKVQSNSLFPQAISVLW